MSTQPPISDARLWDLRKAQGESADSLGLRPADPKARKRRRQEESRMQRTLVRWWQLKCRSFGCPELSLLSIPNGGGRAGAVIGSILKAEGLRKGAPDLFLAVRTFDRTPKGTCGHTPGAGGLFLELKTPEGRVSPEQEVYHEILRKQGYQVNVCRSFDECVDVITAYLT